MKQQSFKICQCDMCGAEINAEVPDMVLDKISTAIALGAMRYWHEVKYHDKVTGNFYKVVRA